MDAEKLVDLVIITYKTDIVQCAQLVHAIRTYGFIDKNITIHIVVNDTESIYQQAVGMLDNINNVKIHRLDNFYRNESTVSGWWTQQYLKLAIANAIDNPWYVTIDSDQGIGKSLIAFDDWFLVEGQSVKAFYKPMQFKNIRNCVFVDFWRRVADYWGLANIDEKMLLSEKPPVIMNTAVVKQMMTDSDVLSMILKEQFHEYGAYWGLWDNKGVYKF
jgi:hypothetical protein